MASQWASIAVLALVLFASNVALVPARSESSLGTPNATSQHVQSSCPHIMKRIGTPQQISGTWYPWEVLGHTAPPSEEVPCHRYLFSVEGERLNLHVEQMLEGDVVDSGDFSYTQNSNGLWEAAGLLVTHGYQLGFASDDDSLLLLCSTSIAGRSEEPWDDVEMSMVLGRGTTLDEAAVGAAVNRTALAAAQTAGNVVRVRSPLHHCAAPAPTPSTSQRVHSPRAQRR
ncbi:hypothetical protein R5R35_014385 [Gryllus longicercus]|uniref:Uncharacterized protein n=1 Tax=Gryllus longicercus TaxID=2509291 RepID=A0AAN9VCG9_9ORTH